MISEVSGKIKRGSEGDKKMKNRRDQKTNKETKERQREGRYKKGVD